MVSGIPEGRNRLLPFERGILPPKPRHGAKMPKARLAQASDLAGLLDLFRESEKKLENQYPRR